MFPCVLPKICALGLLLCSAILTSAQQTYGDDYLETIKDSNVVASAFPDVEGIELLAPAFTKPETLPERWSNGTEGPTELFELGQ